MIISLTLKRNLTSYCKGALFYKNMGGVVPYPNLGVKSVHPIQAGSRGGVEGVPKLCL